MLCFHDPSVPGINILQFLRQRWLLSGKYIFLKTIEEHCLFLGSDRKGGREVADSWEKSGLVVYQVLIAS